MKRISLYFIGIIFITSTLPGCSSSKVYKLMAGGKVVNKTYKTTVPFEVRLGLIIVKVEIEGKQYDFLFDSGAPNVVSYELSETLGLKPAGKSNTRGSQGERHKVEYANLKNIEIGGIQYQETTAAIMDLKKSVVLDCMELDGILGANVMRNSVWQINYQKQEITITNSTDSLTYTTHLDTIPFTTKHSGTPVIEITIGNVTQSGVTLDTGSGGNIDLHYSTYKKTKKRIPEMAETLGIGNSSSGIYGIGKPDTVVYFKADTVQIGTVDLQNQICYASYGKTSSTLGTRFFKNYIVTLDWGRNQMVLDSVSTYDYSELKSFGFKPKFENEALRVGFLFLNSPTGSDSMQLNDQILKIDSADYTQITKEGFCELILDTSKTENTTRMMQVGRGNTVQTLKLQKAVLLK